MRRGVVVKLGGSLYDWPGLGPRLRGWLGDCAEERILVVPGGGPTADVVRAFDAAHALGEEAAHWLALRALSLNAHFVARLLPGWPVIAGVAGWRGRQILDALAFAADDEGRPGCLPHTWEATSDAVAGRAAVAGGAGRLVLLKSTDAGPGGLAAWARAGVVDGVLPGVVAGTGVAVEVVNLRGRA